MAESVAPHLWRHPDFLRLWAGQAVSLIGSQVSFLALPLVTALALDATPIQMGLLSAAGALPALLVGLHAGAIVDRHRRRPIMIGRRYRPSRTARARAARLGARCAVDRTP